MYTAPTESGVDCDVYLYAGADRVARKSLLNILLPSIPYSIRYNSTSDDPTFRVTG